MAKNALVTLILFVSGMPVLAAPNAGTIWQIQSTATAGNTNGGGFDPTATFTMADLATDTGTANTASPVVSSGSYSFVTNDAAAGTAAWIYIASGTHWRTGCWFKIASVAAPKATLDAAIGHGFCRDTTHGWPSPKFSATTGVGVTSDNTATISSGTFGVDRSMSDSATFGSTDLASSTPTPTCTVTAASHSFVASDIGNFLNLSTTGSGTATINWYEITGVSAGAATLDRACGSAAFTAATYALGGALSLGSASGRTDNSFFTGTHLVAGNRIFLKANTGGSAISVSGNFTTGNGSISSPIVMEGYNLIRGDSPTGSNRPLIDLAATSLTTGTYWQHAFYQLTGSSATNLSFGSPNFAYFVKATNISTTAARPALATVSGGTFNGYFLEGVSYRGRAFGIVGASANVTCYGCYFHDSDVGINDAVTTSGFTLIQNSVIADNITGGYVTAGTHTSPTIFINNTFYGTKNKVASGPAITMGTGAIPPKMFNNIFYGFATVLSIADAGVAGVADFNDFFNNTTIISSSANWQSGSNGLALDPQFTNVDQYAPAGAASTNGTATMTDSTANFASIIDGQDFIVFTGGTGPTANVKYPITSHTATTITTSNGAGNPYGNFTFASGAPNYQITFGHDFSIGTNLKGAGIPGILPVTTTTGSLTAYTDIGAVQRQESGSSTGGQKSYGYVQ